MLAALRSRDYRLYWCGSLTANMGFWVQQIALGWLVYDLTRSATWLGLVGFCGNLPLLLLGLLGGAIIDRTGRRTIVLGTPLVIAAAAVSLAVLAATDLLGVGLVIAIAMVAGTASALYAPAMQALIPTLVPPAELMNAISLNSVQFNLARTLGPAAAGLAYGTIGPAGCFAANAAGFLVLSLALSRIDLPERPIETPPSVARALREGLGYARVHPVIGPALLLTAAMSLCGFPYIVLLPALARDTLHLDASGLGLLMAAMGSGAVVGGLGLSAASGLARTGLVATASALAFGLVLMGFAVVRSAAGTAALLFGMGILQTSCVALLNTTIQMAVHDGMRGRVMSMLMVMLFGFTTVGGLVIGTIGDRVGVPAALAGGGAVIVLTATVLLVRASDLVSPAPVAGGAHAAGTS